MCERLPNVKKPCADCPFRKDSLKGWLGKERMAGILDGDSFVCHKTLNGELLQCAGHMLIKGSENAFARLAESFGYDLNLSGRDLVFDTEQDCIDHHTFKRKSK